MREMAKPAAGNEAAVNRILGDITVQSRHLARTNLQGSALRPLPGSPRQAPGCCLFKVAGKLQTWHSLRREGGGERSQLWVGVSLWESPRDGERKGRGLESRVRVGVVTHRQREEKEDSSCLWPRTPGAWGLGSRERLGTTPRSREAELGSCVLLPNPGGGQERPRRKDKEEETLWGGWGFSLGRGRRASREPRGGLRMTDKASGNQMC